VRGCRGVRGRFGVSDRQSSDTVTASTIAVGWCRWYSSAESEENPCTPISSSACRPPCGVRNWVCRLRGIFPDGA